MMFLSLSSSPMRGMGRESIQRIIGPFTAYQMRYPLTYSAILPAVRANRPISGLRIGQVSTNVTYYNLAAFMIDQVMN